MEDQQEKQKALKFKQEFHQFGYKYTEQRQLVLDILLEHPDLHLCSDDICKYLKEKRVNIGQSTVYRTLIMLEKMQIIRKVDLDDSLARYELFNHQENHAHHHLICTKCGAITDIKGDLLKDLEHQIFLDYGFEVKDHCLNFFGLCKKCRNINDL